MRSQFKLNHESIVWIVSGFFLFLYAGLGLLHFSIPGLQELVTFIENISGMYLYAAAFLSILFEGLYIVGSFIPGSTLVILLAVLSQTGGTATFLFTICAIFLGWVLAGTINIFITSKFIRPKDVAGSLEENVRTIKDRPFTTWYPTFRANYEVAQVVSGTPPLQVFWSSLRVKSFASIGAGLYALLIPYFIDIKNLDNQEGFVSIFLIGIICITVGAWQWKRT